MTSEVLNNRYRITKEIGKGGMGRVCLVEDTHNNDMRLALKTQLVPDGDPALHESFMEEFAGVVKLRHPNIAAAYDFGVIAGTGEHYFTTEFIRGVELMPGTENCTLDELLDVIRQVLQGLEFLHSNGYLHNDLKPANILLAEPEEETASSSLDRLQRKVFGVRGQVKLIDFGLVTRENIAWSNIRGTPHYISPERINCQPADRRSDLYSIGCVFYHLATRRTPFRNRDVMELLKLHLEGEAIPIAQLRNDLPLPVIEMIDKLMQKSPAQRFQGADEALRFLGSKLDWDSRSYEVHARRPDVDVGALLFREREVKLLEERFDAVLEGAVKEPAVLIEGDPGVGKSRLVEELRGLVQVNGGVFTVLRGQGVEGHLEPILNAFEGALKTAGVPGLDAVRPLLEQAGEQGDLAYLLIETILHFSLSIPVVVHADDFHAASSVVRHFLLELADTAAEKMRGGKELKIMLIFSRRPDATDKGAADAAEFGESLRIALRPFANSHAREFVQRLFNAKDIPDGVVSSLAGVAQGNADLLLRLARELVARKIVTYSGSRWNFPESLQGVSLPDSIAAALRSRVAELDDDEASLLRWISVCHIPVSVELLGRVTYQPIPTLEKSLRARVRDGILTFEKSDKERRYSFADRELQIETHQGIEHSERQDMHHRLAQTFEELERDREPGALAELLAFHWYHSGNRAAFLRFATHAAEHLQRCGNFALAARYHRKLVKGVPDNAVAKKIQSLLKLSEMHDFLWDLDRVEKNLGEILELGQRLLKPKDRAALLRRLAGVELSRQRHGRALAHLEEAQQLFGEQQLTPLQSFSIEAPRAWALWFGKGPDDATDAIARANELYTEVKPADARERVLFLGAAHHLANLNWVAGTTNVALRIYRENLNALTDNQQQARAACYCAIGSCLLAAGDPKRALAALETAVTSDVSWATRAF